VAYQKVSDQPHAAPVRAYSASRRVDRRGGWGKWLVLAFLISGAYLGFVHPRHSDVRPDAVARTDAQQPEVLLYATSWCPYCAKTREYFRMHGVRYTEYDIEHNAAAEKGYRRLGGKGVPVVVIGEQVIRGYNPGAIGDALRPWLQ
jgi:glutaredoxin